MLLPMMFVAVYVAVNIDIGPTILMNVPVDIPVVAPVAVPIAVLIILDPWPDYDAGSHNDWGRRRYTCWRTRADPDAGILREDFVGD